MSHYNEQVKRVKELTKLVNKKAADFNKKVKHPNAGDLAYVCQQLEEITKFLN